MNRIEARERDIFYGTGMRPVGRGGALGIILLAVLLCGVFFLAVGAYGIFAEDGQMAEGDLPGAVLALRNLVEENEAVAVFLGFSADVETSARPQEDDTRARILAAAEEYIRRHQP